MLLGDTLDAPSGTGSAKHRTILRSARQTFLRLGYEASLDVIAREAGVARRTVFNIFGSKERLFRDIIEEMSAESMPLLVLDRSAGMAACLLRHAQTYVAHVISPEVIAIQRMLASGAPGFQEHMKAVVARNTHEILADLAAYFAEKIAAGEIRPVNPAHAAERFMASVVGLARINTMFGEASAWPDRDGYIRDAVDGFLNGIATNAAT